MASTVYKQYRNVTLSNTAIEVASGFSTLVGWNLINPNSSNVYLKLFDRSTQPDAIDQDGLIRTLLIPGSGTSFLSNEDKFQLNFANGMWAWAVTGIADDNVTAPASGLYTELLYDGNPAN